MQPADVAMSPQLSNLLGQENISGDAWNRLFFGFAIRGSRVERIDRMGRSEQVARGRAARTRPILGALSPECPFITHTNATCPAQATGSLLDRQSEHPLQYKGFSECEVASIDPFCTASQQRADCTTTAHGRAKQSEGPLPETRAQHAPITWLEYDACHTATPIVLLQHFVYPAFSTRFSTIVSKHRPPIDYRSPIERTYIDSASDRIIHRR